MCMETCLVILNGREIPTKTSKHGLFCVPQQQWLSSGSIKRYIQNKYNGGLFNPPGSQHLPDLAEDLGNLTARGSC